MELFYDSHTLNYTIKALRAFHTWSSYSSLHPGPILGSLVGGAYNLRFCVHGSFSTEARLRNSALHFCACRFAKLFHMLAEFFYYYYNFLVVPSHKFLDARRVIVQEYLQTRRRSRIRSSFRKAPQWWANDRCSSSIKVWFYILIIISFSPASQKKKKQEVMWQDEPIPLPSQQKFPNWICSWWM